MEKLRYPEKDPCYLAMAGTALFTHTTFDMLQNHSRYSRAPWSSKALANVQFATAKRLKSVINANICRITAAVEKVELLWQQAFAKARLQLQVFQLREDALQVSQ